AKVFTVMKVIDGDTMHITELPNSAKVRLLGVDTPETKHATKGIQFWGKEASAFTKSLLNGKKVVLHIDEKHQYGVFGRPLVYIEMLDGRDFNALLISEGFARCTREYPFDRMAEYTKLEDVAKAKKKGMWNSGKRAEFDKIKAQAKAAATAAKQAAEARERGRKEQLVKEAIAKGGRYIRGKSSKSVHEPWCKRLPSKNVLHFADVNKALANGCRKHSCFKK
ncbi:MAG: thermonuclease family protein, partial [Planctomycetota bacterium]|nr:thermonuclease family protein [Planctomycetota bacterium]